MNHAKVLIKGFLSDIQREHIARDGKDLNGFCMTITDTESLSIKVCTTDDVLNTVKIMVNKNHDIL